MSQTVETTVAHRLETAEWLVYGLFTGGAFQDNPDVIRDLRPTDVVILCKEGSSPRVVPGRPFGLTVEKIHELLTAQRLALHRHMEATRPEQQDGADPIDQALWNATQAAVWALEAAEKIALGRPVERFEEQALELTSVCATCGCPHHVTESAR